MITIMGATGHTGNKIAQSLLKAGQRVRVIGRSQPKLTEFADAGAEVAVGDVRDAEFLTGAFRGAEAVYALLAADPTAADYRAEQDRMGNAIVHAIRHAGVRRVVTLSSLGAELEAGGPIAGLHAQEQRLQKLPGTHILALRPSWFFENFEAWLPLIKTQGIAGDSLSPDRSHPMVGTTDIANAAIEALTSREWQGFQVRELLGPRDISAAEVASILGHKIDRPNLSYVHFTDSDTEAALVEAGLSVSFAQSYTEMTRAINEGKYKPLAGRTRENTTPTDFATYAEELSTAFAKE